jgi:hypothetical protein
MEFMTTPSFPFGQMTCPKAKLWLGRLQAAPLLKNLVEWLRQAGFQMLADASLCHLNAIGPGSGSHGIVGFYLWDWDFSIRGGVTAVRRELVNIWVAAATASPREDPPSAPNIAEAAGS